MLDSSYWQDQLRPWRPWGPGNFLWTAVCGGGRAYKPNLLTQPWVNASGPLHLHHVDPITAV